MPEGLPGDHPRVCACPGCDEVVVQHDPGSMRLYHSDDCRRKARRLRRGSRATADTADLPAVTATPDSPAADLAPAAEPAAAEVAASGELAAAELPDTREISGSATGHDAASTPQDHGGTDLADDPDHPEDPEDPEDPDSVFWRPDEADGFWDADIDSPRKDDRLPGRHRSPDSQRSSRLKRSHAAAIALTLAASAAGLGLILTQPGPHHPLASEAQLTTPLVGTRPASDSSSSPASHARTHHSPSNGGGGTSRRTPSSKRSRAPSPTPPGTSSPPSPKPPRSPRPAPKRTPSRKRTSQTPSGLISFEDGMDGWSALWGEITVARTTQVAYSGSHSLLVRTRAGQIGGIGVSNGSVARLKPGDTVTFHYYSYGDNVKVEPWAEAYGHPEDWVESVQLPSQPGWVTLSWVVPNVGTVYAIGTQVTNNGSSTSTVALDALSWPGS
jgi:hypothetical protein